MDDCTALELSRELFEIYDNKYLYTSSKEDIKNVIQYLEKNELRDKIDMSKYNILISTYMSRMYKKKALDAVWELRDCFI